MKRAPPAIYVSICGACGEVGCGERVGAHAHLEDEGRVLVLDGGAEFRGVDGEFDTRLHASCWECTEEDACRWHVYCLGSPPTKRKATP